MLALRSKKVIVLLLVSLSTIACANKLVRVAQIGKEIGKAAVQLQQDEIADFRAGRIDKASHKDAQSKFELLGRAIKIMNSSIAANSLDGVTAAIGEIRLLINSFSATVSSSGRLQIWITVINGFLAMMVALL